MKEGVAIKSDNSSTFNQMTADDLICAVENYTNDGLDQSDVAKEERVQGLASLMNSFNNLDAEQKNILLSMKDESYDMPIIANALIKHDMVNELQGVIEGMTPQSEDGMMDSVDEDGNTFLHVAMKSNSPKAVRMLLDMGFDPLDKTVADESTPLLFGIDNGSFEAVDALLGYLDKNNKLAKNEALAVCDDSKSSALHAVVTSNNLDDILKMEMMGTVLKYTNNPKTFELRNSNNKTAQQEALDDGLPELYNSMKSRNLEVLVERVENSIIHPINVYKATKAAKDDNKVLSESDEAYKSALQKDLNKVLRRGNKLQKFISDNPDQIGQLDELLGDDTPAQQAAKPGRGQAMRMRLDGFEAKLGKKSERVADLNRYLTRGADRSLEQQSSEPMVARKRTSEESLSGNFADRLEVGRKQRLTSGLESLRVASELQATPEEVQTVTQDDVLSNASSNQATCGDLEQSQEATRTPAALDILNRREESKEEERTRQI